MKTGKIDLRFWPKRRRIALVVAAGYWLTVAASYFWALIIHDHDEFGIWGIPFMVLSLPWSAFFYGL